MKKRRRRECECGGGPWRLEIPLIVGVRIVAWRVASRSECWHRARAMVGLAPDYREPYAGYWCGNGVRLNATGTATVEHNGERYVLEPGAAIDEVRGV